MAVLILAASVLGFFGEKFWIFDLFAHFRWLYIELTLCLLVIVFIYKKAPRRNYIILGLILFLNAYVILPFYLHRKENTLNQNSFKIVSINLNSSNNEVESVLQYITKANADIIVLLELTPDWAKAISSMSTQYPNAKAIIQSNNFGIGILSKSPFDSVDVIRDTVYEIPFESVQINLEGSPVTVIAAHPFPPIGAEANYSRNNYLEKLANYAASLSTSVILCGDLNITPWSQVFISFLNKSSLIYPRGFGVNDTWPVALDPITIPVDHCLTNDKIVVTKYNRGPNIGSDHFPIEMDFQIKSIRRPASPKQ
jgi:endonuclease/exonuclease/phosphatase (EEP) superfamily protein YafD